MGFRFEGTLPEVVAVMLDWSRRVVRLGPSVDATATAPAQVEAHLERIRALFTRADKPRRR